MENVTLERENSPESRVFFDTLWGSTLSSRLWYQDSGVLRWETGWKFKKQAKEALQGLQQTKAERRGGNNEKKKYWVCRETYYYLG